MKLLIITDSYEPMINGVSTTLSKTIELLNEDIFVIHPGLFSSFALPHYKEIPIAIPFGITAMIEKFDPEYIHIATEGPLGWAGLRYCVKTGKKFTTSYHTQFPEYLNKTFKIPVSLTYSVLRYFHKFSSRVMVNTSEMVKILSAKGFNNLAMWSRGVDLSVYKNQGPVYASLVDLPGPILMNVGRVSKEKNLEAFYQLDVPGTKVQVGSGPQLEEYKKKYPDVVFIGPLKGEFLASAYRGADVFVFPSKTDTFGLVMLESIASGVPVAAYPVTGPIDVIVQNKSGKLDNNLKKAVEYCLQKGNFNKEDLVKEAAKFSWEECTCQFRNNLVPITG
jgi:glycosyltransferase involved in cell wall biosynthesis